jgi:hypothetical protein
MGAFSANSRTSAVEGGDIRRDHNLTALTDNTELTSTINNRLCRMRGFNKAPIGPQTSLDTAAEF